LKIKNIVRNKNHKHFEHFNICLVTLSRELKFSRKLYLGLLILIATAKYYQQQLNFDKMVEILVYETYWRTVEQFFVTDQFADIVLYRPDLTNCSRDTKNCFLIVSWNLLKI
jgi:hypothetical protein